MFKRFLLNYCGNLLRRIMNSSKLARGDSNEMNSSSAPTIEVVESKIAEDNNDQITNENGESVTDRKLDYPDITAKEIENNEEQLKERIDQCRNIIESLKQELHAEKLKMEKETKSHQQDTCQPSSCSTMNDNKQSCDKCDHNLLLEMNSYSPCLNDTLNCDESLMEYEKQLQRYQNTLNMAQIEKKNAIRKQMLSKAFNLKLLEVENQCNIELLRVKQSLQCLEPLRMIANNWKTTPDNNYDLNSFELIPRFPELNSVAMTDLGKSVDETAGKIITEKYGNNPVNSENSLD